MKAKATIIAIILMFLFISQADADEKILIEGKGFRNLIIGELNNNDVVRIIGEPDSIEETPKEWSRNYIYSSLGLKINFHNGTLNTIMTLPNFDGKTSKGITLKSSLKDIEEAYGEPVVAPNRTKETAKGWVYDGITIAFKQSRYDRKFKGINKIVIHDNNKWRWKEKNK